MILSVFYFALGFLISLLCTPWVIRLSNTGIGLDDPNENRKNHETPIPRLGGMPIMLAISIGLILIFAQQPQHSTTWFPILLGSLLMYGLGLWDDLKPLGARKKLAGQIAIACLVYYMGLSIDRVSYPGGAWSVELGPWSMPVTIFWLIAVPNIVNLIDGCDGLAAGLAVFMAVTLGIVGLHNEQLAVAWFAFTMAGAALGFLVFNFPPARIFLGDGGAYLIGFTIAALSLISSNKGSVAAVLLVTIIALGVPILDTSFALLRRAVRGVPIFRADREHIHHRLENLGFSKRRIVLSIYGICVVLSLLGLSIVWTQAKTLPIGIAFLFLLAVGVLRYFHYVRSWDDFRQKLDRILGERREMQYALMQAQLLEMEVDRCHDGEEFWLIFHESLRRVGFVQAGESEEVIAIHVRYNGTMPWILYAPRGRGSSSEWHRIAECFRPVYVKARAKWRV
jgi:UDP-GlcNAc:undecaprenyl-phosphate GlcNAc-1-phosphate transferase